jgi:hypothetical protein
MEVSASQTPTDFRAIKTQFGDDFTKFDAAVPMKSTARKVGNKAYHELSTEFNKAVPGAQPINQRLQGLIPASEAAQRADEINGPTQRAINRLTRPTGGALGAIIGGPAVLAAQETLASPTAKMAAARGMYGTGKAIGSTTTSGAINTAGRAGDVSDTVAKQLSDAILGGQQ